MTVSTIPLQAVPSQSLSIVLSGQNCEISVYQKSTGLYFDLWSNNQVICTARLCVNGVAIVRNTSSGFIGEFYFIDNQLNQNPDYLGLGSVFELVYIP